MDIYAGGIAVVTGSSSGIGNQLCKNLLAVGKNLIVVGLSRSGTEIHSFNIKFESLKIKHQLTLN